MAGQNGYRILTPDGLLTRDTFVLSPEQPNTIKAGCVLVVGQRSGTVLSVHESRLLPAEASSPPTAVGQWKRACMKCGKVQGVVEDQVTCPNEDGGPCGLVEPSRRAARGPYLLAPQ
jgi:hypothetical protein